MSAKTEITTFSRNYHIDKSLVARCDNIGQVLIQERRNFPPLLVGGEEQTGKGISIGILEGGCLQPHLELGRIPDSETNFQSDVNICDEQLLNLLAILNGNHIGLVPDVTIHVFTIFGRSMCCELPVLAKALKAAYDLEVDVVYLPLSLDLIEGSPRVIKMLHKMASKGIVVIVNSTISSTKLEVVAGTRWNELNSLPATLPNIRGPQSFICVKSEYVTLMRTTAMLVAYLEFHKKIRPDTTHYQRLRDALEIFAAPSYLEFQNLITQQQTEDVLNLPIAKSHPDFLGTTDLLSLLVPAESSALTFDLISDSTPCETKADIIPLAVVCSPVRCECKICQVKAALKIIQDFVDSMPHP
jgi:hypothetical protein